MGFYNAEFRKKIRNSAYGDPFGVLKKGILIENLFPWTLEIPCWILDIRFYREMIHAVAFASRWQMLAKDDA